MIYGRAYDGGSNLKLARLCKAALGAIRYTVRAFQLVMFSAAACGASGRRAENPRCRKVLLSHPRSKIGSVSA